METTKQDPDGACDCHSLRMAARYVTAFYDRILAPSGVRTTQYAVLNRLRQIGPTDIKPLAASMAMDRTTLASNLKPLEREGLLHLTANPQDRRARRVEITREGLARLAQCRPLWLEAQARFEDRYGSAKAATMRALLSDVLATGLEPWAE